MRLCRTDCPWMGLTIAPAVKLLRKRRLWRISLVIARQWKFPSPRIRGCKQRQTNCVIQRVLWSVQGNMNFWAEGPTSNSNLMDWCSYHLRQRNKFDFRPCSKTTRKVPRNSLNLQVKIRLQNYFHLETMQALPKLKSLNQRMYQRFSLKGNPRLKGFSVQTKRPSGQHPPPQKP